jgi:ATP-binding cassette subfamily B protein
MSQVPPLVRLFRYAKPYRFRIFIASLSAILNTLFDLLPDVLIGFAVDVVVNKQDSWIAKFGFTDVKTQVVIMGFAALFTYVLTAVTEFMYLYFWRNLTQTLQHDMRLDAYAHIQQLEMSYHEEVTTGGLLSIINDDINQLERFLDFGAYKVLYLITTLILVGSTFIYLSPLVALCALLPAPVVLGAVIWFRRRLAPRYAHVRSSVANLVHRITNNITGMATIKSYTGEDYELKRLHRESAAYKAANHDAITYHAAFSPVIRMIVIIAFTATVIVGGWQVLDGYLEVGAYSMLVCQVQKILWPAIELVEVADLYEKAMASIRRVFGLLDTPLNTVSGALRIAGPSVEGRLQFNNVSFAYANNTAPLFNNVSFAIEPGSTVAFVGATGSGKSTLIKLLLRFYEINGGSITLDGTDIRDINLVDLRKSIGLVSQDVFLFHGTIRENIAYGSFDASLQDVIRAAKIAHIHDFILTLPFGYDTVVGERGQKLSGGQRQRLSIARAVLKAPPIFIFDEATSSVDHETEQAIAQSLQTITKHHTVIIIAHRLSTIGAADKIFVLEKGSIVESGTHEELLQGKAIYHDLWQLQTGSGATKSSLAVH